MFVRLAADGPSLADALGTLPARCADQPIEALTYSHRLEHTVDANWKTYTDNYGEGYHVPLVHPGLHRQIDAREYRVAVHDGWAEHTAPARDGAIATGVWLWRYPNLGLNLSTEGMNVERWVPDGPRRTRIIYDFFFADVSPATEAARRRGRALRRRGRSTRTAGSARRCSATSSRASTTSAGSARVTSRACSRSSSACAPPSPATSRRRPSASGSSSNASEFTQ